MVNQNESLSQILFYFVAYLAFLHVYFHGLSTSFKLLQFTVRRLQFIIILFFVLITTSLYCSQCHCSIFLLNILTLLVIIITKENHFLPFDFVIKYIG